MLHVFSQHPSGMLGPHLGPHNLRQPRPQRLSTPHATTAATVRALCAYEAYAHHVAAWLDEADLDNPLHAAAPLDLRLIVYLVDVLGIDPRALLSDGDGAGWPLFRARVERVGQLFRFTTEEGEGVPALVTVARDLAGEGVEMVAWSSRDGWAASETGALPLLGAEWLCPLANGSVDVHEGVRVWLRAGRRGLVVMNQRRAMPILREAKGLIVADVEFGTRLQHLLTVKSPPIQVREEA